MKHTLEELLRTALRQVVGELPSGATPRAGEWLRPSALRGAQFESSVALHLAGPAGRHARALAAQIVASLPSSPLLAGAAIAGPGLINFRLSAAAWSGELSRIHAAGSGYGNNAIGSGTTVVIRVLRGGLADNLSVDQGRQLVYAEALKNILAASGFQIELQYTTASRLERVGTVTFSRASAGGTSGTNLGDATVQQLLTTVGPGTCRFFFLMGRYDQPLEFDIHLAQSRTVLNPLCSIQYAYARVASAMKQLSALEYGFDLESGLAEVGRSGGAPELQLLEELIQYPEALERAAQRREPNLVIQRLRAVANALHRYHCARPFVVPEARQRNARVALALGVQQVIRNGLTLLGVDPVESL